MARRARPIANCVVGCYKRRMNSQGHAADALPKKSFQQNLWDWLDAEESEGWYADVITYGIMTLIVLNVFAGMVETIPHVQEQFGKPLFIFEVISSAVFAIEYIARLWAAGADSRYRGAWGRLRFALTPMALIDLAAILPSLLLFTSDLRALRTLRLVRLLRGIKLFRYSRSLALLRRVLRESSEQLLLCVGLLFVLLVSSAALLYAAENEAQPDAFSSIPASLWWAVCTLTTVGYGDVYPVTPIGKLLASIISIVGVGFVALPAGILAGGFSDALTERREQDRMSCDSVAHACPHCGKLLEPSSTDPTLGSIEAGHASNPG